jgi:hypothetical protein
MLHVFALYLLAQFREKRAYPFVVKMFSAPGESSELVRQGFFQSYSHFLIF